VSEKLLYEKEVERLQKEIVTIQNANIVIPVSNDEQPIIENKHKELNFLNHIQDEDEMVYYS